MIDIILNGANGRMGQVLQTMIAHQSNMQVVAGIDREAFEADFPTFQAINDCQVNADVVIDFSHYTAVPAVLDYCAEKKIPVVVATTGLTDEVKEQIAKTAEQTAVFFSANMSLGINLLAKAIREITPVLEEEFNIEIVEKHHNQKKDAPSGTALALAESMNEALGNQYHYVYDRSSVHEKRDPKEIGIASVRGGSIVGDHDVIFAGKDEVITFNHTAYSKAIFAKGALEAAKFLAGKEPGLYDMSDVVQL